MAIPKRPKKCPECGEKYQPTRPLQPCCDKLECKSAYAIRFAEAQAKRRRMQTTKAERIAAIEDRKIVKLKLEKLKTARDWTKEAQIAANAYVRERDKEKPCISCGALLGNDNVGGGFDAGHFRSRGSAPHLRFDPNNIHGQCKRCNRHLSGNVSAYRIGLINRFGLAYVEKLESDQSPRKYTIEDLKAIKAHYVAKLKELKK